MRNGRTLLSLIATLLCLNSCLQAQKSSDNGLYIVDKKIKEQIDKKVTSYNGVAIGSLDFKMYKNDSLVDDTCSMGKSFECLTNTTLEGDTISITGFLGMFSGFGFQIALFKDTCIVSYFAKSDAEIYKVNKTDSLTFGVSVPCKSYKLTLVNKPTYKKGDVVEGIIELTSEDYFELANGNENKYSMQLVGYFRTEPLESLDDKYNRLMKKLKSD